MAKILERVAPKAVVKHCAGLGLDRAILAACLGVHPKSVERWLEGVEPNEAALRSLEKLEAIHAMATALLKQEYRKTWFVSPNPSLAGERPVDAIRRGELDRVKDVLAMLEWGIYS